MTQCDDNCPFVPNPSQTDSNGDGVGDACDGDFNGDGFVDAADDAILTACMGTNGLGSTPSGVSCRGTDMNSDGIVDNADRALFDLVFGREPSPDERYSMHTTRPTSKIISPGVNVRITAPTVVISGIAYDTSGGSIVAVDVSVDGGATWQPATGLTDWNYTWAPTVSGEYTVLSRAVDDRGNLETPNTGIVVTVIRGCGLGGLELAPVLLPLLWLHRRRKGRQRIRVA
jgi:hypothetical protein